MVITHVEELLLVESGLPVTQRNQTSISVPNETLFHHVSLGFVRNFVPVPSSNSVRRVNPE